MNVLKRVSFPAQNIANQYFTDKCPTCQFGCYCSDGFRCVLGKPLLDGCEAFKNLARKIERGQEHQPNILF